MRTSRLCLLVLLIGGLGSGAAAQGFNRRYDPIVPGNAQFAWGVEQLPSGDLLVIHNQLPWIDSLYYNSRTGSLVVDQYGGVLADSILHTPYVDAFPGWSNPADRLLDGSIIGGGATTDTNDLHRVLLYRFASNGTPIGFTEIQPTPDDWIAYQCKRASDGGVVFTGVTDATGFQDIFLLKTDSLGNVQWWQTYGHPTRLDYSASVDLAPDGGFYIGGFYPQTTTKYLQWVIRTDSVGNLIWQEFRGSLQDESYTFNAAVLSTSDSMVVYASGLYSGGNDQQTWPQLAKLDTAGNTIWDKTYGTAFFGTGFFAAAEVPGNHDLIACGQRYYQTMGGIPYSKGLLLRTNSQGDSLWMREYFYYDSLMTDGEGTLRDVQPTPDGGFVAVGAAYGSISGNNPPGLSQDVWVLKVDSMGCVQPGCHIITGIESQVTNLTD
ncbi:MAG: hypothetical protein KDC02_07555, partial [Flavobacteriales bacterium]|nr:hypothetical protein [Flavobacteriales bacterium]